MSKAALRAALSANVRPASLKLALLAFAKFADEQSGLAWPSMSTVADACSVSVDQARRLVHELARRGYLKQASDGTGGKPGSSTVYRVAVETFGVDDESDTPSADASRTPSAGASPTPSADARGLDAPTPCTDARDPLHACTPPLAPTPAVPLHGRQPSISEYEQLVLTEIHSVPHGTSATADAAAACEGMRAAIHSRAIRLLANDGMPRTEAVAFLDELIGKWTAPTVLEAVESVEKHGSGPRESVETALRRSASNFADVVF